MPTSIFARSQRLGLLCLLAGAGASLCLALASTPPKAAQAGGNTCYATANNGNSYYSSGSAQAVRDAISAAPAGGVVKIAGYCAGVANQNGTNQVALITKTLTLAGGYTPTNWVTAYPLTQPTQLDAIAGGRVVYASAALTLESLTLMRGLGSDVGGGGAYLGATTLITNSTFSQNSSGPGYGGGLYASAGNSVFITNSTFSSNQAAGGHGGGGMFYGALALTNVVFTGNTALNYGGGFYVWGLAQIHNVVLRNNSAGSGGGGGDFYGPVVADTLTVIGNQSSGGAAGLYTTVGGTFTNLSVLSNTAAWHGGGGDFYGTVVISGATFFNNRSLGQGATGLGGAGDFYGPLYLTNTTIISNSADSGGGLYFSSANPAQLVNVLLARNTAATNGNALYINNATSFDILHTTIASPTQGLRAALYVNAGGVNLTNVLLASYAVGVANNGGSVVVNRPLFFNVLTTTQGSVTVNNPVTGDPHFSSPATDQYFLNTGSAALDAGQAAGVSFDIQGEARPQGSGYDIGYDESLARLYLPFVRK